MKGKITLSEKQKTILKYYKLLGANWVATDHYGQEIYSEYRHDEGEYGTWIPCGKKWENYVKKDKSNELGLSITKDKPQNIDQLLAGMDFSFWKKLPIDTKVEVYFSLENKWYRRYYAGVRNGKPCYYCNGTTSWSNPGGKTEVEIDEIRVC